VLTTNNLREVKITELREGGLGLITRIACPCGRISNGRDENKKYHKDFIVMDPDESGVSQNSPCILKQDNHNVWGAE